MTGPDPTPDDVAIMRESLEGLLKALPVEHRQIALQKLQAYSNQEIADTMSCSVATVERRLAQVREIWREWMID